jgi:hypothetical protein
MFPKTQATHQIFQFRSPKHIYTKWSNILTENNTIDTQNNQDILLLHTDKTSSKYGMVQVKKEKRKVS